MTGVKELVAMINDYLKTNNHAFCLVGDFPGMIDKANHCEGISEILPWFSPCGTAPLRVVEGRYKILTRAYFSGYKGHIFIDILSRFISRKR
jgi:hypothetical protein